MRITETRMLSISAVRVLLSHVAGVPVDFTQIDVRGIHRGSGGSNTIVRLGGMTMPFHLEEAPGVPCYLKCSADVWLLERSGAQVNQVMLWLDHHGAKNSELFFLKHRGATAWKAELVGSQIMPFEVQSVHSNAQPTAWVVFEEYDSGWTKPTSRKIVAICAVDSRSAGEEFFLRGKQVILTDLGCTPEDEYHKLGSIVGELTIDGLGDTGDDWRAWAFSTEEAANVFAQKQRKQYGV